MIKLAYFLYSTWLFVALYENSWPVWMILGVVLLLAFPFYIVEKLLQ